MSRLARPLNLSHQGGRQQTIVVDQHHAFRCADPRLRRHAPVQVALEAAMQRQRLVAGGRLLPEPPPIRKRLCFIARPILEATRFHQRQEITAQSRLHRPPPELETRQLPGANL